MSPRAQLVVIIINHKWLAGRSGLAVTCLTAVCEVLGSNRAVGSCVYRKNHCGLQPCTRAVCNFPAVPVNSAFYPPWDGK